MATAKAQTKTIEATYNLTVITFSRDGFVATDKSTGKTVTCSRTEDQKVLVCDGAVRKANK